MRVDEMHIYHTCGRYHIGIFSIQLMSYQVYQHLCLSHSSSNSQVRYSIKTQHAN